jgi:hypothetical protein
MTTIPSSPPSSFHSSLVNLKDKVIHIGQQNLKDAKEELLETKNPPITSEQQVPNQTDWTYNILYIIGLFLFATLIILIQGFFVKILGNYVVISLFNALASPEWKEKLTKENKSICPFSWLVAVSLLVWIRILFF